MNESDLNTLKEIISHCESIENRITKYSIDEHAFIATEEFQDMLLMPVFQIGELANSLSDELKEKHHHIPWHEVIGFRNIIAHDYGIVDPLWAWNSISVDIPSLKKMIEGLL